MWYIFSVRITPCYGFHRLGHYDGRSYDWIAFVSVLIGAIEFRSCHYLVDEQWRAAMGIRNRLVEVESIGKHNIMFDDDEDSSVFMKAGSSVATPPSP